MCVPRHSTFSHFSKSPKHVAHQGEVTEVQEEAAFLIFPRMMGSAGALVLLPLPSCFFLNRAHAHEGHGDRPVNHFRWRRSPAGDGQLLPNHPPLRLPRRSIHGKKLENFICVTRVGNIGGRMQERHARESLMRKTCNLGLPGCPYYKRVLATPD